MKRLTGLFLGAGASHEAGMPLVWDLTAEIKDWLTAEKLRELNASWRLHGGGHADEVVEDLISVLARPDVHYEGVLGYMEAQFRRQRSRAQDYHGLYAWLVELVYVLLYYRQVNNHAFFQKHLPYYDGIRALTEANEPLWVFSLNHDVIVEAIAARLSIPLFSGFSATTITLPCRDSAGQKKGAIHAEILTKHELENRAMNFPNPPRPGIYLLKIHGALDVFAFNDGNDLLKLLPSEPGQDGVFKVLRAANEDLLYPFPGAPSGRVKTTNEIAYADDEGVMQFLRRSLLAGAHKFDANGTQVLPKSMLKHFTQNLNFVTTLVCIGYGFGDVHINAVLREWLGISSDRRLEIVSPIAQEVPAFLLHLSPQVSVTKASATDYLDNQAGIVRTRREKLEKRLFSALRQLGKKHIAQRMASFVKQKLERRSKDFQAKLKNLPQLEGCPDFSKIGDPKEVAQQWAAETRPDEDELLNELLESFEKNARDQT